MTPLTYAIIGTAIYAAFVALVCRFFHCSIRRGDE